MKSNYKNLGQFIRQVDVRNIEGKEDNLLGVSVQKTFIPSIANTVGTDFSKYKVVKKGQFTYIPDTSRRGDKIGIALLKDYDEGLVSNVYTVFEIEDESALLPDYLMLWFSRPEFDRYARFKSHGSVREVMDWDGMCKVELPVPPIDKQREIVHAYQVINDRIALKRKINDNLLQQAQAIFKHWFTDNPNLDDMKQVPLAELCLVVTKGTTPTTLGKPFVTEGINFIKVESILDNHTFDQNKFAFIDSETNNLLKRSIINSGDIIFTIAGTLGRFALIDDSVLPANTNQAVAIIRANQNKVTPDYLYSFFLGNWHNDYYRKRIQQAVQANLNLGTIKSLPIPILPDKAMSEYLRILSPIITMTKANELEITKLRAIRDTLLPKLMSGQVDVSAIEL